MQSRKVRHRGRPKMAEDRQSGPEESDGPIDRALQLELLQQMRQAYPRAVGFAPPQAEELKFAANLVYLEEHGLCQSGVSVFANQSPHFQYSTITARGLDFLAGDGGLSAVLGVVTVRLHADTIRALIADRIDAAPLPASEKSALKHALSLLSEAGLRAATTDLVRRGLDHLPDAIGWLHTLRAL